VAANGGGLGVYAGAGAGGGCWQVGSGASQRVGPELDAIQLSIFSHRFMSTAEQMGRSAAANHFSSPPNA